VAHLTHSDDGVLATVPYSFNVDVLRKIPDSFFSDEGIVICWVHDSCIVEL
jgi:hypothetical protein